MKKLYADCEELLWGGHQGALILCGCSQGHHDGDHAHPLELCAMEAGRRCKCVSTACSRALRSGYRRLLLRSPVLPPLSASSAAAGDEGQSSNQQAETLAVWQTAFAPLLLVSARLDDCIRRDEDANSLADGVRVQPQPLM
jgi:hypothetical protein